MFILIRMDHTGAVLGFCKDSSGACTMSLGFLQGCRVVGLGQRVPLLLWHTMFSFMRKIFGRVTNGEIWPIFILCTNIIFYSSVTFAPLSYDMIIRIMVFTCIYRISHSTHLHTRSSSTQGNASRETTPCPYSHTSRTTRWSPTYWCPWPASGGCLMLNWQARSCNQIRSCHRTHLPRLAATAVKPSIPHSGSCLSKGKQAPHWKNVSRIALCEIGCLG